MPTYPVTFEADYVETRDRVTVFFRLILSIPHWIWLAVWGIAVYIAALIGWVIGIFTGRLPDAIHDFIASYTRGVLRQTAWMVIPAATAVALAAPYLLRLFGGGYASHAAGTLALLALSTIPNIVTTLYVRIYRVRKRMTAVVAALAAQCGLVLVLGPVLLAAVGISGVGLAWLVSQTFVALALVWLDPEALGLRTPAARAAGAPG